MLPQQKALSPEDLDFAPGLLAIQESPPARLPRTVLYVVGTLFTILLLWTVFGKLDIVASADGRLIPRSYVQVVQPAEAGIVKEILVREGETVQAGQVLLRMDTHEAEADSRALQTERSLKFLELRRIDAELSGQGLPGAAAESADLNRQVQAQYLDRRQAYLDAVAQAKATLNKAQYEYESGTQVLDKLRATNPILQSQADAYAGLGKEGYAAKVMVDDKQRAFLENQQDLRAQVSTVAGLAAAVAAARQQVSQITSKYRSELQNERVDAQTGYVKLDQAWLKQSHKSGLLELRAPQAGVIKDLTTHTIGTVVAAGTVLLSLVPENEPMFAEVQIKNADIGFVTPKQKVKLKLAAYPFQRYGMIDGEVLQVWPDARDEEPTRSQKETSPAAGTDAASSTLAYKALVSLNHQTLEAGGQTLRLVPGMQVVAEINQGRRTILEYLLSPVQKTLSESGRER